MILTVDRADGVHVLTLKRSDDGAITIAYATDRIRPDVDKWVRYGLSEFVGPMGEQVPRHTKPDAPDFFARLAAHLRSYGFIVVVSS